MKIQVFTSKNFGYIGRLIASAVLITSIGAGFSGCGDDSPKPPKTPESNVQPAPQPRPQPKPENVVTKDADRDSEQVVVKRFRPVRDPFKSAFADKQVRRTSSGEATHPLQQYSIGQLKLLGIIWGIATPVALIATPSGDEYVAKTGTPVGTGDGKVVAILPDRVVIVERYYDYRGQLQTEKYEMVLADEGN